MTQTFLASLTRIADFDRNPYDFHPLDQEQWDNGDYVITEVTGDRSDLYVIETCRGALLPVNAGDQVIGALGRREATLEGVGSYEDVVRGEMHAMTGAGLLGRFTSVSILVPKPLALRYRGHIVRDGCKATMKQFALQPDQGAFATPTILIIGTSMSAGKTITGRIDLVYYAIELG